MYTYTIQIYIGSINLAKKILYKELIKMTGKLGVWPATIWIGTSRPAQYTSTTMVGAMGWDDMDIYGAPIFEGIRVGH